MKHLTSLIANSFLIMVLFAMLFLPIGSMGLSSTEPETQVLSETDYRQPSVVEPTETYIEETSQSSEALESIKTWQQIYNRDNN